MATATPYQRQPEAQRKDFFKILSQLPYVRQPQEKYPSKPHGFCQRLPIQKTPVPIFPCHRISEQRDRVGDLLKGSCYWSRGLKPTLPCIQRPPPPHPAINTHPVTRNHMETERYPAASSMAEVVPSVGIIPATTAQLCLETSPGI